MESSAQHESGALKGDRRGHAGHEEAMGRIQRPAEPQPSCLFPGEPEIAKLILGPSRAKLWPSLAIVLERHGLPKIDPQFGGRYWPKVRLFLDDMNSMDGEMTLYFDNRPSHTTPGDRTGGVRARVRERNQR